MADKVIKIKIDVTKINTSWLFTGDKGVYLDMTLLYNEKEDSYGNNGMIVQDVPKSVYLEDKTLKGAILGNGKEWGASKSSVPKPGVESGELIDDGTKDDLPF